MEKLITLILALIVGSISILGLFTDVPFVKGNISNIILAISSIILTIVAISKNSSEQNHNLLCNKIDEYLNKIDENLEVNKDQILKGLEGVEFVKFNDPNEQIEYIINRLHNAKISVSDFTWAPKVSASFDSPVRQKLEKKYVTAIKSASKKISYREIFIFSHKSRIEKLKEHYQKANSSDDISGYSCAFYEDTNFPRLQFMLIDDTEVIFTSGQYLKCAIKNTNIVEIFSKYYSTAWDHARKLIENGEIADVDKIEKIIRNKKSNKANAADAKNRAAD